MLPRRRLLHLLALAFLPLLSLHALAASPAPRKIRVLATIAPIHSWTLNVAAPDADVDLLLPGDVGPHDFQLRPQDLRKIRSADLIVANGLGVESWLDKALRNNARESARNVVRLADSLPKDTLIHELPSLDIGTPAHRDHDHDAPNPHIWLDPSLARHGVSNLVAALVRADPDHATGYRTRAEAYLQRLEALDRDFTAALKPAVGRPIVTFHDAFPYLCRRYGIVLAGVVEEVPSVEPSPKYLARLSGAIRAKNVQVIFTEPQFNPRLVRQLGKDLGVRFAELDVLETGKTGAEFYESGMRRNLQSLVSSLQ